LEQKLNRLIASAATILKATKIYRVRDFIRAISEFLNSQKHKVIGFFNLFCSMKLAFFKFAISPSELVKKSLEI
jgi:hypothetical protein